MSSNIQHGGNLREAAAYYQIPLSAWLDLSTGINPRSWPVPEIPTSVWQRLPEANDDLLAAAQDYYGCDNLLPISGSQAAIQTLPFCRPFARVGIVSPCYAEHPYWWQQAGHDVIFISADQVDAHIATLDVLLLINPNNPDTQTWPVERLQAWHQQLSMRGGWLIVDEAFVDSRPEASLLAHYPQMPQGLIVLRSLGKFFGLAGIRLGFLAAEPFLLAHVGQMQGPWSVSHPARYLGALALRDTQWQQEHRNFLVQQSDKLRAVISKYIAHIHFSDYFCYFQHPQAEALKHQFALRGIWVRYFENPAAIRLGLPANDAELRRLDETFSLFF